MSELAVVSTGKGTVSLQGLDQFEGVSAQSVGAMGLCAHIVAIPPGGRARAHRHAGHETPSTCSKGGRSCGTVSSSSRWPR